MRRLFLGLFFLLLTMRPALADEVVSPQFVAPLMNWVAYKMGIPVASMPAVYASRARMVARIGDPQRQSAQQASIARALYVPGEVVIDDEFWDDHDTRTISFLVHELVHHVQYVSGRPYPCANAKEWEAYMLQNQWLAEHGLPPAVDESWIAKMSGCGNSAGNGGGMVLAGR